MKPSDAVFIGGIAFTVAAFAFGLLALLALDDAEVAYDEAVRKQRAAKAAADYLASQVSRLQGEVQLAEQRIAALAHESDRNADDAADLRDALHKLAHGEPLS